LYALLTGTFTIKDLLTWVVIVTLLARAIGRRVDANDLTSLMPAPVQAETSSRPAQAATGDNARERTARLWPPGHMRSRRPV
jgi:hypothetical protein